MGDDATPSTKTRRVLVSHTGVGLTRDVAFRFALDPTLPQQESFFRYAGAARFAFNHHIGRVKANLGQRQAEVSYGVPTAEMTPSLSWSKVSLINEFNQFKNGQLPSSPANPDGTRGLAWRSEVRADVFECASGNAAQALANFSNSLSGARAGKKAGMPRFKSRHKTTPSFKLRSKSKPGATAPVRVAGPKAVRLPTIGEVRVHGCTKKVRRMLAAGRLHLYGATVTFEHGRWWVSLQGVAAAFHHERRYAKGRHDRPAGLDLGIASLAVIADDQGVVLRTVAGVKALQHAQASLRRANKTKARTKPGSNGRKAARVRLVKVHARAANIRAHTAHEVSAWCVKNLTSLTIEDLNVAGMVQLRSLARAVSDAGMGDLARMITYKAAWYGLQIVEADRWFPSSKTCSTCGTVKADLTLSDRTYRCDQCGLVLDRDVNAAVNLARWPAQQATPPHPQTAAEQAA
jgi:putative transposase